jgi:predicted Zn-dependent protease
MTQSELTHLDQALSRLERALDDSPADHTELAWIETRTSRAASSGRQPVRRPRVETTVLVRVRERRRFGFHRTGGGEPQSLQDAVRSAFAQTRIHEPKNHWRAPLEGPLPDLLRGNLFDPRLGRLSPEEGRDLLLAALEKGERAQLEWTEGRIAMASSRGLRLQVRVSSATLFVAAGRGAEAGTARGSGRTLKRLDLAGTVLRARGRRSTPASGAGEELAQGAPTVLSPEAATAFLEELSLHLLAPAGGEGYFQRNGGLLLSPAVNLVDDGGDPRGMPFPFDLKGAAKLPLRLVQEGLIGPMPRGLASPEDQLGAFSAGGGELRCSNLLLEPGKASEERLLQAAEGGLWVGSLSQVECLDPRELRIRCRARGMRRIRGGRLAEALADRLLETTVPGLLGHVRAVGSTLICRAHGSGVFGGTTAPALLLDSLPEALEAQPASEL